MSFWKSGTGDEVTGDEKSSFAGDFSVIPEGTMAIVNIKDIDIVEDELARSEESKKMIVVKGNIVSDDFKNRETILKIKCFHGKPESIQRNLNMLKRLMDLCGFKPKHGNSPSQEELRTMCGKLIGQKIGEWSLLKEYGNLIEGNFVREIWPTKDFKCEIGVKSAPSTKKSSSSVDSAFSRSGSPGTFVDDDIPF